MINKILSANQSEPCSRHSGTSCTSCTIERTIKPQIFIETPKRLPVPVIVCYLKEKQLRFQDLTKRSRWRSQKPQYEKNPKSERFTLCRWYKKKKALRRLIRENEKEKEKEKKRAHDEYERERINEIMHLEYLKKQEINKNKREQEKDSKKAHDAYERKGINDITRWDYVKKQEAKTKDEPTKHEPKLHFIPLEEKKRGITINDIKHDSRPWSRLKKQIHFTVEKKRKKMALNKEKSKRIQTTKKEYVKKYKPKNSFTYRFVNCCYRIFCQFYCYLSFILIIALVVIYI